VPVGLGVKIAERSDCNFHDKENIRLKQLLDFIFLEIPLSPFLSTIYIYFQKSNAH